MIEHSKHVSHYLVLFGILFISFAGLILFSYDRYFQIAIASATGASYVAWGVVHHYIHKDLYIEVVLEYLAITILGVVVLLSLILR